MWNRLNNELILTNPLLHDYMVLFSAWTQTRPEKLDPRWLKVSNNNRKVAHKLQLVSINN